jgi:hypothetical protein
MIYTFVFLPSYGTMHKWNYQEVYKRIDHVHIKTLAPTATFHSFFHDSTHCKFAKLCHSIDNEMQNAFIYEVTDEAEAQALMADMPKMILSARHSYYNSAELRYVFKDIDYDRMSTQAVFELLSKSVDKEKEKTEQKVKLKNLARLKKEMDKFVATFNWYPTLTTEDFKKTVAQLSKDFEANHDEIKQGITDDRKEANKNKVSIRQKLSRFAVYNSNAKPKTE